MTPRTTNVFDLHVHTAPDLVARCLDDVDAAVAYRDAGYDGCVLKNHNEATGGRAAIARKVTGFAVYGSIVLNRSAGGFNPAAVATELALGARVVWMPTEDALVHRRQGLPRGLGSHPILHDAPGCAVPPLESSGSGALREILGMIADADAVLATGHLSSAECGWLLEQARRHGVRRLLLTHPSYTAPNLSLSQISDFVDKGAKAEITAYQLFLQPGATPAFLARVARAAGEHLVLSSDAGNPAMPEPVEALDQLIEALASEGIDRNLLLAAASSTPRALVLP